MTRLPAIMPPGTTLVKITELRALSDMVQHQARELAELRERLDIHENMMRALVPQAVVTQHGMPIEDKWFGDPDAVTAHRLTHRK